MGQHTKGDLEQMQSLPLSAKISMTKRRIYEWYEYWQGDVYLSFSGGKDSTVLKHIIDGMNLGIPSVFDNTGLEYPEIRKFAMSQPNVITVRPKMMFTDVIKKYGYPVISKEVSLAIYEARRSSDRDGWAWRKVKGELINPKTGEKSQYNCDRYAWLVDAPFNITDHCCHVMKKAPLDEYARATKRKTIIATMAVESHLRKTRWMKVGCNAFEGKKPKSAPISFWTEQDILHYIKEYDVPYCSAIYGDIRVAPKKEDDPDQITFADYLQQYDGEKLCTTGANRTGCMFCMFGCHLEKEPNRFQRMKITHPRQYEYCIGGGEFVDGKWQPNKEGLGLGYVLDYIGVKY